MRVSLKGLMVSVLLMESNIRTLCGKVQAENAQ